MYIEKQKLYNEIETLSEELVKQDLENIIVYLRYSLSGDIIADKYKLQVIKESYFLCGGICYKVQNNVKNI